MSVSFFPYVKLTTAQYGTHCRIAPGFDVDESPNLHNAGAGELLSKLGLADGADMWDCDPVPVDVFAKAVWQELRSYQGQPSAPTGVEVGSFLGLPTIDHGRPEGYYTRHLVALMDLVERARDIGATHIGWG